MSGQRHLVVTDEDFATNPPLPTRYNPNTQMKPLSDRQRVLAEMQKLTGIKTLKKKTKTPKQLKAKYEHPMRDLIIERDGHRCQIAGKYHICEGRLVADHRPVSRSHNRYFFDPGNLTCVCSSANFLAQNNAAVSTAICEVVIKREGQEYYDNMVATKGNPFKMTEQYVLDQIESLRLALLKKKE